MIRIFFTYVLPLIAPTLLYLIWNLWRKKYSKTSNEKLVANEKNMLFWCLVVGVVLMGAVLVSVAFTSGFDPTSAGYVSPHLKDGKVIAPTFNKIQ